jgi:large subunit ribosomal protein L15e
MQPVAKPQALGMYHRIRDRWADRETPEFKKIKHERLITWRREPETVRVERPTRLDRARELGYKAKQGIVVARTRVRRGGQRKRAIRGGRRPKRKGIARLTLKMSLQRIAEGRCNRKFPNMEVLNSYWVGEDGQHKWFEVILVDPSHPAIQNDKNLSWITDPANSDRANRGLTSAGKKGRGLRTIGVGTEKVRPSRRANVRKKLARGQRTQKFVIGRKAPRSRF